VRIGIIGPGALGCLFAARLYLSVNEQDEILLIDHRAQRAAELNRQGILYESDTGTERCPILVSSSPKSVGRLDALLCCVKSHNLEQSLQFVAPLLDPSTLLLFLQNGIDHLKYGEQKLLPAVTAYASSSEGATCLAPGHIRHAGKGHTTLGFLFPGNRADDEKLEQLATTLRNANLESSVSTDIRTRLWGKLFINVGINALTAVYNRTNGQLLTSCAARSRIKTLVREAENVAIAGGITIEEDPVAATLKVCKHTGRNISSMLQDIRNLRATEIDTINGAISRLGRENGVPTPLNDEVIVQVKKLEERYLSSQTDNNEN
jgi:2-dehydropantoate 2-reductase